MARRKFGNEEDREVTAVEVEVSAPMISEEREKIIDVRIAWPGLWAQFAKNIRAAGATCDIKYALKKASEMFGVDMLRWLSEDFAAGTASGRFWTQFVDEVERDLALESVEPDGKTATFGEFIEAVARQIDMVVCKQPAIWALKSPHEKVTGIREATVIPHILSVFSLLIRRYAQWTGEGVGRAGEQIPSPVHDPNWRPSGNYPWSIPKAERRKK